MSVPPSLCTSLSVLCSVNILCRTSSYFFSIQYDTVSFHYDYRCFCISCCTSNICDPSSDCRINCSRNCSGRLLYFIYIFIDSFRKTSHKIRHPCFVIPQRSFICLEKCKKERIFSPTFFYCVYNRITLDIIPSFSPFIKSAPQFQAFAGNPVIKSIAL